MEVQQNAPIYILPQKKSRTLMPKMITLLVLGIVFYVGILVNISLLELTGKDESLLKTGSLILIGVVVLLGVLIAYHHASSVYRFYRDRISFEKKQIYYKEIMNTKPKKDVLDRVFKTYSINLGNNFFLKNIPDGINLEQYLGQLIEYVKKLQA